MPLNLTSRFCGNVYIIHCTGRIVLGEEAKALEGALEQCTHEFCRVVLNLSEVDRLDSIGLGLLVRYTERLSRRGGGIRLASPPASTVSLLNMTKLSELLPSYPTEEDAILSFLKQSSPEETCKPGHLKVLVLDPSADLCVFIKMVLSQHGFDVRSTCSFRDAKTLLQVDEVDYILVGPGTPQLTSESVASSLKALVPRATAFQLDASFKTRDADEATKVLLQTFGINGALSE
jgi:anti-anti-sigma factor